MKARIFNNLIWVLMLTVGMVACKKDEDDDHDHDHNEEELITTVKVNATDKDGNLTTFSFADVDGPGGNDPVFDTIALAFAGAPYAVTVEFLDESKTPAEDITAEIEAEDDEHIVCYTSTSGSLTVQRLDTDENNLPVGLISNWTVSDAVNGTLTISLKHQPGIKDGSCTPGETDVEVAFPITID